MRLFTLTAGRTGTAWLSNFLSSNLGVECNHEQLGVDQYFYHSPDISTLRWFNTHGYNDIVKSFWKRKFEIVNTSGMWLETSHLLGKAGLIEHLSCLEKKEDVKVVVLRRAIDSQCMSYIMRRDFVSSEGLLNSANIWQFFLDFGYRKNLVDYRAIFKVARGHDLALPIWYALEIETRQIFYQLKFSGDIKFIEVSLEDITSLKGASEFLKDLGYHKQPVIPEKTNQLQTDGRPDNYRTVMESKLRSCLDSLTISTKRIAETAIERGLSF